MLDDLHRVLRLESRIEKALKVEGLERHCIVHVSHDDEAVLIANFYRDYLCLRSERRIVIPIDDVVSEEKLSTFAKVMRGIFDSLPVRNFGLMEGDIYNLFIGGGAIRTVEFSDTLYEDRFRSLDEAKERWAQRRQDLTAYPLSYYPVLWAEIVGRDRKDNIIAHLVANYNRNSGVEVDWTPGYAPGSFVE